MSPMAEQAQMLNYLLGNGQGAMYLGPGVTGRMTYTDPLIAEKNVELLPGYNSLPIIL